MRQYIRDGHPDFVVTADSWPALLFPYAKAHDGDIEHGLFQSAILVKVGPDVFRLTRNSAVLQAFKFIFTSPTSAHDINSENDLEKASRSVKRARSQKAPTRGNVASLLGMRSVTPRSIAYVAVQVGGLLVVYTSKD